MKLVELSGDAASLEMTPREVPGVMRRLATLAAVSREERATYDLIHVGDDSFIYANDWDDPCLISKSASGTTLLRSLLVRPSRARRAEQATAASPARSAA